MANQADLTSEHLQTEVLNLLGDAPPCSKWPLLPGGLAVTDSASRLAELLQKQVCSGLGPRCY